MTAPESSSRDGRMAQKIAGKVSSERSRALDALRNRPDYTRAYEYFLGLAESGMTPEATEARTGRRVVRLLCVQAPLEVIHAAGLHPYKIFSGSGAACGLAVNDAPAIMCPLMRSILGAAKLDNPDRPRPWILPTTCDWVVKFPEMLTNAGSSDGAAVHWMELPHLKDGKRGQDRWLDEVYLLKKFAEAAGGRITRRSLIESIDVYHRAWRALARLDNLRGSGRLPSVWFMLIANTFFCDSPLSWSDAAEAAAGACQAPASKGAKVFLAGSPIFFPNFKLPFLLEEAGLETASDDLCSSGRLLPGAAALRDYSEFGILSALAQRYHQGCLCPTFIDNDRRINNILASAARSPFGGVVFHTLKGCHPYDLEGFGIEAKLKNMGLKFIRVETDYSAEDSGNLTTRLEAFRRTLEE
jgi:benzoyl-CoA reductase/2-hydroxyglutaryl-CoA dehydratase subunit BcrC/BadD/HgdB